MKIYASKHYSSDSNTNEFIGEFSFQPFNNLELFSNRSVKGLEENDIWQEEVEVIGDLFVITETDCEGYTKIHGVTGTEQMTFSKEGKYTPIISTESVVEVIWEDLFDPKIAEKKKLEAQIAELQSKLNSL